MFHSIRWRLVASYLLVALFTVSIVGVLTLSLVERFVEQRVMEDLKANAASVARQAAPLMRAGDSTPALRELARTAAFLGDFRVRILDEHQRVLVDSGSPTGVEQLMWLAPQETFEPDPLDRSWILVMPHSQWPGIQIPQDLPFSEKLSPDVRWTIVHRMEGVWSSRFQFRETVDEPAFTVSPTGRPDQTLSQPSQDEARRSKQVVTVAVGEGSSPLGYVELSGSPDFGAQALRTTRRAFLLAAGGAMILAVAVGLLVSQGVTAPLRRLTATASRMSQDLSTRAPVKGQDEIGQLAQQLNRMAERLETSFAALTADRDALRRFIADASHELRTPITALKNFSELLQGPASEDPEAQAEFLAESAAQIDRLEWITKNLLDLSRLDAGLATLDLERQDASEIVQSSAAAFKTLAREKEIDLQLDLPSEAVTLVCDRARVELALSNLLHNAVKFSPPNGHVEIGTAREGEAELDQPVRFWVQDDGPGIEAADRPHVFERFYRGRANQAKGSGLGLAIVKSIVQAHNGRVWVESEPGAGSRFVIELPGQSTR